MSKILSTCTLGALLLAGTAAADSFTITLHNGSTFESRYQPKAASWDESKVLLLTGVGNWIALERTEIASITTDLELRGYGRVIDTTTKDFGFAPNDRPVEEGEGEDAAQQEVSALERILSQSYDTPLVSEPGETTGGFPVFNVTTTPGGGTGAGSSTGGSGAEPEGVQ